MEPRGGVPTCHAELLKMMEAQPLKDVALALREGWLRGMRSKLGWGPPGPLARRPMAESAPRATGRPSAVRGAMELGSGPGTRMG